MGIKPDLVKDNWSDIDPYTQMQLMCYEQIREYEEHEANRPIL